MNSTTNSLNKYETNDDRDESEIDIDTNSNVSSTDNGEEVNEDHESTTSIDNNSLNNDFK